MTPSRELFEVDKIFDIGWQDLRILSFFSIFFLELMIWVGVPLGKGQTDFLCDRCLGW